MLVVAPSFNKTEKVFGRTQIGNRKAGWLVFFPPPLLHVFSFNSCFFFLACRWMSVFVKRRRPWYYYCIPVGLFLKPSTLWWQDPCSWISSSTVHVSLPIVSYPLFFIVFMSPGPWHCRRWNPREEEGGVVHYGTWCSLLLENIYGCLFKVLVSGWRSVRGRKWQQQAKEQAWSSTADPSLVHVVSFPNSNAKMHLLSQRKDKILPPEQQNSVNKCWITSFFVYLLLLLIMVCHRPKPLCFFVYLSLFLFMVSQRTNSYASLFISCCFCSWFLTGPTAMPLCLSFVVVCSWFFSQNQLLCFFVYLLLCLFMVPHRTNSYASLFILHFVHGVSLLGTDHTNCGRQWIDTFHKKHCFSFLQQERMMSSWRPPTPHPPPFVLVITSCYFPSGIVGQSPLRFFTGSQNKNEGP